MRFNTSLKIEAIAPKKDTRSYLNAPYLDAANKRLIATDGFMMAIIPVELDDGDTSGHIPREAFIAARKAKVGSIKANGLVSLENEGATQAWPRPDLGTYPEVDRVFPSGEPACAISFNAELLLKLVEALTAKTPIVKVEIFADNLPMRVTADENTGLLMPCRM